MHYNNYFYHYVLCWFTLSKGIIRIYMYIYLYIYIYIYIYDYNLEMFLLSNNYVFKLGYLIIYKIINE